jgi:predicted transcriptional regulator
MNAPDNESRSPSEQTGAKLTGLEMEIMQVLWELGTATAGEIREALLPERPLAQTTILTVLEKLRKKKALRLVPTIGRARKFRPVIPKESVAEGLLKNLMGRFFDGSPASLVAHMVKDKGLDKKELEEIRRLLEQSQKEVGER